MPGIVFYSLGQVAVCEVSLGFFVLFLKDDNADNVLGVAFRAISHPSTKAITSLMNLL